MQPEAITFIAFFAEMITRSLTMVGFMLQKMSLLDIEKQIVSDPSSRGKVIYFCQPKWMLGMFFAVLGPIC